MRTFFETSFYYIPIMPEKRTQEEELRLETEKSLKYRGVARIRLQWLHFRWNEPGEPDIKNVERLKKAIEKDCRRLDARNHIVAIISQGDLDDAIRASRLSNGALLSNKGNDYAELVFPPGYRLECLHGRHRILAAKEALPLLDKWWTVDLYLSGTVLLWSRVEFRLTKPDISHKLKTWLTEEYSNEKKPGAGDIYRKVRQYHFERNPSFETRWKTWLSDHEVKNLKRLQQRGEWIAAFDDLLDIPGLWGGMLISTLHTAMDTKFDEVRNGSRKRV